MCENGQRVRSLSCQRSGHTHTVPHTVSPLPMRSAWLLGGHGDGVGWSSSWELELGAGGSAHGSSSRYTGQLWGARRGDVYAFVFLNPIGAAG